MFYSVKSAVYLSTEQTSKRSDTWFQDGVIYSLSANLLCHFDPVFLCLPVFPRSLERLRFANNFDSNICKHEISCFKLNNAAKDNFLIQGFLAMLNMQLLDKTSSKKHWIRRKKMG